MHRRVGHSNYDGKIAGLYDMEETLGRGHFAVVKLARHVFTGEKVAVKVIDKSKLDEVSRSHLFQEVRCMKLVQHPNVVRLYEVIDTQTKLYLILELGDGGDLYDYIMRHESGLSEEVARTYFRQIVRAISYCHRLHVVHRDLKPENVVFFEKLGMVKLTDFGFSNRFCPGQKLETSCGSLAYSAPEILLGDSYDAPAVDVWSLGVILYMLVCGQAPFQEANDSETLTMIMDCKYSIPTHVSEGCKELIARMLVRQPERRASLEEIASNSWLVSGSDSDPAESLPLVSRQQVSEEHHNLIITKMVNGNIATKEDILEALDKNEYNHITATYFLLAERKLRAHRQEEIQKNGSQVLNISSSKPNNLTPNNTAVDQNTLSNLNPTIRSIPRTAGDVPQNFRVRKCSIVQEEDDEDEMSSCSGRDDHGSNSTQSSVSRRGSRSEGKLSHVIQEKLSQNTPEKHSIHNSHLNAHAAHIAAHVNAHSHAHDPITISSICNKNITTSGSLSEDDNKEKLKLKIKDSNKSEYDKSTSHKFLKDSDRGSGGVSVENISQTMKGNLLLFDDDHKFSKNNIDDSDLQVTSEAWIKKPENIDIGRQKSVVNDYLKSSTCNKWRMGSKHQNHPSALPLSHDKIIIEDSLNQVTIPEAVTTTILNVSSTVSIPLHTTVASANELLLPNYKSLPTVGNTQGIGIPEESLSLNEILEERANDGGKNRIVRRTSYEQRRSKFHKTRTASCSSSDASDDDSEGRKKRANKLGTSGKPLQQRRDSHDDSSDSQDPGGNCGGGGGGSGGHSGALSDNKECTTTTNSNDRTEDNKTTNNGSNDTTNNSGGGKRCSMINQATINVFERRHRTGRRRSGETRLRESQSLNRITEVQEAEGPCHNNNNNNCNSNSNSNIIIVNQYNNTSTSSSTTVTFSSTTNNVKQKAKGFGARLLHSWSLTTSSATNSSTSSSSSGSSNSSSNSSSRKSSIIYEEKEKEKEKISCVKLVKQQYLKEEEEEDNNHRYHNNCNHKDIKSQCKNDEIVVVVVGGNKSKVEKCVENEIDCKDGEVKISENRLNDKSPIKEIKKNYDDDDDDKDKNRSGSNNPVVVNKVNTNTNSNSNSNCKNKKFHLLSRYFAIHKKLCIPLPSIFGGKGRLYKAQSCGSITRDRVNVSVNLASSVASPKSVLLYSGDDMWGEKKHNCNHHNQRYRGSDGDINQNLDLSHLVNNVVRKDCSHPITNNTNTACHIHFGDTSKCCSLC